MVSSRRNFVFSQIDMVTVLLYVLLVIFGLINIYSSKFSGDQTILSPGTESRSHVLYMAISLGVAFFIILLDGGFIQRSSYVIFAFTTLMLVAVLVFGDERKGATAWIDLGSITIQPSEFAKFGTAMAISRFIGNNNGYFRMSLKKKMILFSLIVGTIFLIMLEPDAGSAMVFCSFVIPLFREGFSMKLVVLILYAIALSVVTLAIDDFLIVLIIIAVVSVLIFLLNLREKHAWLYGLSVLLISLSVSYGISFAFHNVLEPHQKERIEILFGKKQDARGAGYNIIQSKIAIGSGGVFGKGFLNGTQTKMDFVPEQHSDFIFCTVGEEWGFVGSTALMLIYLLLMIKMITMAERQRTLFSRVYGYCIVGIIFIEVFINIGMTIGLMPVIGIPLPFMSYGGSSLLAFTIMLFVFIKLDAYRFSILQ